VDRRPPRPDIIGLNPACAGYTAVPGGRPSEDLEESNLTNLLVERAPGFRSFWRRTVVCAGHFGVRYLSGRISTCITSAFGGRHVVLAYG